MELYSGQENMNKWELLYKYYRRSAILIHCTSTHCLLPTYEIWMECLQYFRSYARTIKWTRGITLNIFQTKLQLLNFALPPFLKFVLWLRSLNTLLGVPINFLQNWRSMKLLERVSWYCLLKTASSSLYNLDYLSVTREKRNGEDSIVVLV